MSGFYQNKVVIITGSTQGLGREMALQVLQEGGKVIINGRSASREKEVKETFKKYMGNFKYVSGDVSNPESANQLVISAVEFFGKLDVVINNAGMSAFGKLEDADPLVIRQVIDSNVIGSLMMSRFSIPELKKTKGNILFVGSLVAIHGLGGNSLYSSAKKAYIGIVESLKKELHAYGIFVGINYLGFTQNDAIKRTYNSNGDLEKVPERKGLPVATQADSARMILNQIKNRKYKVIHSWLGKVNYYLNLLFPGIVHLILLKAHKKQST